MLVSEARFRIWLSCGCEQTVDFTPLAFTHWPCDIHGEAQIVKVAGLEDA